MNTITIDDEKISHNLGEGMQELIDSVLVLSRLVGINIKYLKQERTIKLIFNEGTIEWVFFIENNTFVATWADNPIRDIGYLSIDPDEQIGCKELTKENFKEFINSILSYI